ncbi:hypothetical protein GW17_00018766 [Ensete ventricosum]|nr:hypothetical protein GW17_00018766 [Ensete ventricosum]
MFVGLAPRPKPSQPQSVPTAGASATCGAIPTETGSVASATSGVDHPLPSHTTHPLSLSLSLVKRGRWRDKVVSQPRSMRDLCRVKAHS